MDDGLMVLKLCKRDLESEGYDVHLAPDGGYSMSPLKEIEPDLVLLEIMMLGLDGYQALDSIRHHVEVPVIMITWKPAVDSQQKALALDADDYVIKSFHPLELVNLVGVKFRHIDPEITANNDIGRSE